MNTMVLALFPILFSIIFFIFSYLWIDHGLVTFLSSSRPFLGNLYNVIKFTTENRIILAKGYFDLTALLFVFQLIFLTPIIYKKLNIKIFLIIAVVTTLIFTFSFPFLSRDIFTYYFSAKMFLFYKVNPYIIAPVDFMGKDLFVGLLHNITSPYLYGQGFLIYTSLLMLVTTFNKVLTFFFIYKTLNAFFFFLGGYLIYKAVKDKRIFAIWFFNPYLLIEWLINGHNDVVMTFFFILAVYLFYQKRWVKAGLAYLYSILIKFVSFLALPVFFLKGRWRETYFKFAGLLLPIILHFQGRTVEPWYLLWSYMFLPFANLKTLSWFLFSILGYISSINYYGFLESGGWGMADLIPNSFLIMIVLIAAIFFIEYWGFIRKYSIVLLDRFHLKI